MLSLHVFKMMSNVPPKEIISGQYEWNFFSVSELKNQLFQQPLQCTTQGQCETRRQNGKELTDHALILFNIVLSEFFSASS